ncbi:exocyst complex component 1-like isoform X3 [Pelodiscus sinensis]|uniref:exocyst complex component 1-like isoform X3 n=1 Tax=Pelodiscus sinensis TaxID=13735 RepID=UPI003F6CD313
MEGPPVMSLHKADRSQLSAGGLEPGTSSNKGKTSHFHTSLPQPILSLPVLTLCYPKLHLCWAVLCSGCSHELFPAPASSRLLSAPSLRFFRLPVLLLTLSFRRRTFSCSKASCDRNPTICPQKDTAGVLVTVTPGNILSTLHFWSSLPPGRLAMASPWILLEKDVFNPHNERLLEIVRVWKTGKRRKNCILCVAVAACRPMQLFLEKVKKADRGDQYKTTSRWPLKDLKLVDGKNVNQECLDFELQFEKVYKWTAVSADEKNAFLRCLWKLNRRYLASSIAFVGVPSCTLEGKQSLPEIGSASAEAGDQAEHSAYQEMTPKETADMLRLMEEYEPIVSNAVAFAEKLSTDLQVLDEANLQAIISSEKQVTLLMDSIDQALVEVAKVEGTLQIYEELLGSVKQQMDHIQQGNSLLHRIDSNHEKLMGEILFLTSNLDLSEEHRQALSRGDLSSPSKVTACIAAAGALASCMNVPVQPGYRKLQAIAEQLIMFETLKQNFENNFISHITSLFERQGSGQSLAQMQQLSKLISPTHGPYHDDLLPYAPLMAWLRKANPILFHDLPKVYAWNLSRLYEREIKAFFELARLLLQGRTKEGLQDGLDKQVACGSRQPPALCRADSGAREEDEVDRGNVVKLLEQVLRELPPLCVAEQRFIEKFFMLSQDAADQEVLGPPAASKRGADAAFPETSPWPKTKPPYVDEKRDGHPSLLLAEIFSSLEPELRGFVDACSRVHPFSCLQVLVTLNDHMFGMQGSAAASCPFLHLVLSNTRLLAKSNFNKCIGVLCREMEEAKVPSRAKGGILPLVSRYEEFVNFAEEAFRWAQRRGELDKAHAKLVDSVFGSINRLASANLKVNTDMVMMENFHHIHCFLCQKKIHCLESKRREAKQRYGEHLERYVIKYLGQPLEKLNHFFEGVKARVAQGVREEEVSFQLAYSKQELRKVIEKYPGREVKRALETLYRKIHKHLSPEENLLPVVWRAMEQEFIRQYQEFEHLIQRCYPGSGITMDFTVEDLLSYFISITQAGM